MNILSYEVSTERGQGHPHPEPFAGLVMTINENADGPGARRGPGSRKLIVAYLQTAGQFGTRPSLLFHAIGSVGRRPRRT